MFVARYQHHLGAKSAGSRCAVVLIHQRFIANAAALEFIDSSYFFPGENQGKTTAGHFIFEMFLENYTKPCATTSC